MLVLDKISWYHSQEQWILINERTAEPLGSGSGQLSTGRHRAANQTATEVLKLRQRGITRTISEPLLGYCIHNLPQTHVQKYMHSSSSTTTSAVARSPGPYLPASRGLGLTEAWLPTEDKQKIQEITVADYLNHLHISMVLQFKFFTMYF